MPKDGTYLRKISSLKARSLVSGLNIDAFRGLLRVHPAIIMMSKSIVRELIAGQSCQDANRKVVDYKINEFRKFLSLKNIWI